MGVRNPKGATINLKDYESDEIVSYFEPIHDQLLSELRQQQHDLHFDVRDLPIFLSMLQKFQQDNLGVFNKQNNHLPLRIPAKLFNFDQQQRVYDATSSKTKKKRRRLASLLDDTQPIYTILLAAYSFLIRCNWKKWDFENPARKTKHLELVQYIRDALIERQFLTVPRIAFSGSVLASPSTKKVLTDNIRKIDAELVDRHDNPTHILHGCALHDYDDMEEDWFRTLEKQDDKVLVHWWYYPDSYDSWLPQTEQFADPEDAPQHVGPWHLNCRWLQDTVKFNELMNEEDYEDVETDSVDEDEEVEDEDEDDGTTARTPITTIVGTTTATNDPIANTSMRPPKRKMGDVYTDMTKVAQDEEYDGGGGDMNDNGDENNLSHPLQLPVLDSGNQPLVHIRDVEIERPLLGSRQRKNEFEPYMNGDITNISQHTSRYVQIPEGSAIDKQQKTDINSNHQELSSLCYTMPQNYGLIYLPDWFDMNKANNIEKLALPEFFDDSLDDYLKYRNFMVQQYHSNPAYYVTVSACKAAFPDADLVSLVRLHSFLELYEVINAQIDPRRRLYNPVIDSEPDAFADLNQPRSLKPPEKLDIQYLRKLMYDPVKSRKSCAIWNASTEDSSKSDGPKIQRCKGCNSDCSAIRYQCLKRLDVCLCIDCFVNGNFSSVFSSSDFLRMEEDSNNNGNNEQDMDEEWTDEEILLLLEGVDRYDDDWLMVSEHVGTHTKEECITQFLQMPITDEFLTAKLSNKELEQLPFTNTPNPVMTMVTYLSAHINPGVAASAAKAAMKELLQANTGLKSNDGSNQKDDGHDNTTTMEEDIIIDQEEDDDSEQLDTPTLAESSPQPPGIPKKAIMAATSAAIQAAASQARKLSSYEDQEIQHWTRLAVKTVTDKLAMKIQQYEEFDRLLETDHQEMKNQSNILQSTLETLRQQHFNLPSTGTKDTQGTTTGGT